MSARRIAFRNARLVDPASGMDVKGGLLVENGRIADIGPRLFNDAEPNDPEVIDARGLVLAPGLIDANVHTGEPGAEQTTLTPAVFEPRTVPQLKQLEDLLVPHPPWLPDFFNRALLRAMQHRQRPARRTTRPDEDADFNRLGAAGHADSAERRISNASGDSAIRA